jgi:hypothetical protein
MATRARSLIALALLAAVTGAASAGTPRVERVVVVNGGELWAIAPDGSRQQLTRLGGSDPAVAPEGRRIAFTRVRNGTPVVHVLDILTGDVRAVAPGRDPAWAPDGRLAIVTDEGVVVGGSLVAPGAGEPAFAPDGRLAVTRPDGVYVDGAHLVTGARSPAYAPDGRLAVTLGTTVFVGGTAVAEGSTPAWSPDGRRIVVARADALWTIRADGSDARRLPGSRAGDKAPAWALVATPAPSEPPRPPDELLPDLDQRAPSGLTVSATAGRFLLGFASATDNVGRGPVWIRGRRPNRAARTMRADQLVRLRRGGTRLVRGVGLIRYTWSATHTHWHLMRFMHYELRRNDDFEIVARDRKTGFCLADRYGLARHRVPTGAPVFTDNCGAGRPHALRIDQGSSVGYTDRYGAYFHGQNVEVTRLPAGRYWLVHRSNPSKRIRELTYGNNAAAVLIRLTWPDGRRHAPRVRVLRSCPGAERC